MSYSGYGGSLGYNRYRSSSNQKCCCPPKGDKGPRGEKGTKGDKGIKGQKGEMGPIGPKGQKGQMFDLSGNCYSNYVYWDTTTPNDWKVGGTTGDLQRVHIGCDAGSKSQGENSIAIGNKTATNNQDVSAIAIGFMAGNNTQGRNAIAIGSSAGFKNQGKILAAAVGGGFAGSIAIGNSAGFNNQAGASIAIGIDAGMTDQAAACIAIGLAAGYQNQALADASGISGESIAIGNNAGMSNQFGTAIAIGKNAGLQDQSNNAIAIGTGAGQFQERRAIAIGVSAGAGAQGTDTIAIGNSAGGEQENQAIAIGLNAGLNDQSSNAIAIGTNAGTNQKTGCIAIGTGAGQKDQSSNAIAIGSSAGGLSQGGSSIAIGTEAGKTSQGNNTIAIGKEAGQTDQSANTIILNAQNTALNSSNGGRAFYVAPIRSNPNNYVLKYDPKVSKEITYEAQSSIPTGSAINYSDYLYWLPDSSNEDNSGNWVYDLSGRVHIGAFAGGDGINITQDSSAVAIGWRAGFSDQSSNAIAIGSNAGSTGQKRGSVAIGDSAGLTNQKNFSVAVGTGSGSQGQGEYSVALGFNCGNTGQGNKSIAIGHAAGQLDQSANSIIINATGISQNASANCIVINAGSGSSEIDASQNNAFYVNPIRYQSQMHALYYNSTTKEITYDVSGGQLPTGTTYSQYLYWDSNSSSWEIDGDKVHIGSNAGETNQDASAVAIGWKAGSDANQGVAAIAIGSEAGRKGQATSAIAIGNQAASVSSQGAHSISIGTATTAVSNSNNDIAIGTSAGASQSGNGIAIGTNAGGSTQGRNAIAIGQLAGGTIPQSDRSIILNASTSNLEAKTADSFFVKPIRNSSQNNSLYYNDTTGEITWDASNNSGAGTTGSLIAASILTKDSALSTLSHTDTRTSGTWFYILNNIVTSTSSGLRASNIILNTIELNTTIRIYVKFIVQGQGSKVGIGLTDTAPNLGSAAGDQLAVTPPNFGWSQYGIPDSTTAELTTINAYFDLRSSLLTPLPITLYPVIQVTASTVVFTGERQTGAFVTTAEGAPVIMEAYSIPSGIYQENQ